MTEIPTAEYKDASGPPPEPGVRVRNFALVVIAGAAVIFLLQLMQPVLIPMVLGGLLFYALSPAVDGLQKLHIPRALGAAVVLVTVVAACGALAYGLQGQASTVIDELPTGARRLAAALRRTPGERPGAVEKVQQAADALKGAEKSPTAPPGVVRVQVEEKGFQASEFVWAGSLELMSGMNRLAMVLLLTYFLLLYDQLLKRKVVEIVGSLSQKKIALTVFDDIAGQIERFLVVQIFTSAVVALVTGVALWALGVRQAALWGLIAGTLNSIPYYGPLVVAAGLSVVGFLQFGTLGMTAAVAGTALLITTLEGWLLTPMLMGRVSSMNTVAVFVGLLFWSWIWGIWGMLLAVPMMMVLKAICDHVEPLHPVGHLLGD